MSIVTTKYMQETYGKDWDTRPHDSNETYGRCECDECIAWDKDYKAWENTSEEDDPEGYAEAGIATKKESK